MSSNLVATAFEEHDAYASGWRYDTPPGGALLFEIWRSRSDGKQFVRLDYVAQTLEQMRKTEPLTQANPPVVAPIMVPGCGRADLSCTWNDFSAALHRDVDPAYVVPLQ